MISLAVKQLIEKGAKGKPDAANIMGLPALVGASVYSFMCHHSLPGLVAPISGNSHIKRSVVAYYRSFSCEKHYLIYLLLFSLI